MRYSTIRVGSLFWALWVLGFFLWIYDSVILDRQYILRGLGIGTMFAIIGYVLFGPPYERRKNKCQ